MIHKKTILASLVRRPAQQKILSVLAHNGVMKWSDLIAAANLGRTPLQKVASSGLLVRSHGGGSGGSNRTGSPLVALDWRLPFYEEVASLLRALHPELKQDAKAGGLQRFEPVAQPKRGCAPELFSSKARMTLLVMLEGLGGHTDIAEITQAITTAKSSLYKNVDYLEALGVLKTVRHKSPTPMEITFNEDFIAARELRTLIKRLITLSPQYSAAITRALDDRQAPGDDRWHDGRRKKDQRFGYGGTSPIFGNTVRTRILLHLAAYGTTDMMRLMAETDVQAPQPYQVLEKDGFIVLHWKEGRKYASIAPNLPVLAELIRYSRKVNQLPDTDAPHSDSKEWVGDLSTLFGKTERTNALLAVIAAGRIDARMISRCLGIDKTVANNSLTRFVKIGMLKRVREGCAFLYYLNPGCEAADELSALLHRVLDFFPQVRVEVEDTESLMSAERLSWRYPKYPKRDARAAAGA